MKVMKAAYTAIISLYTAITTLLLLVVAEKQQVNSFNTISLQKCIFITAYNSHKTQQNSTSVPQHVLKR